MKVGTDPSSLSEDALFLGRDLTPTHIEERIRRVEDPFQFASETVTRVAQALIPFLSDYCDGDYTFHLVAGPKTVDHCREALACLETIDSFKVPLEKAFRADKRTIETTASDIRHLDHRLREFIGRESFLTRHDLNTSFFENDIGMESARNAALGVLRACLSIYER